MNMIKDIAEKTMTEEKRLEAKNDFFAFYVGRPISYALTVPFLKLNIKPNCISFISFFPTIIGFLLIGFGKTLLLKIIGWIMFFLWNLLDGVDGNVARYKKEFSATGELWDATSGYLAMVCTFLGMGIGCYYGNFVFLHIDKAILVILGSLSSIMIIFPRLVMHKRISSIGNDEISKRIKEKKKYGILKIIALNLTSISGFIQVLMLISIIFRKMDIFTIFYFLVNLCICITTLKNLLKENKEK